MKKTYSTIYRDDKERAMLQVTQDDPEWLIFPMRINREEATAMIQALQTALLDTEPKPEAK